MVLCPIALVVSSLAGGDATAPPCAADVDPAPREKPAVSTSAEPEAAWTTRRVGGDLFTLPTQRGELFFLDSRKMGTDAALPAGYPAPTPPSAIELKKYPKARRAQVSSASDFERNMQSAFWPLFHHINQRNIPMTAPVEMEFTGMSIDDPSVYDRWTMAFLYEHAEQGELQDQGVVDVVDVVDAAPVTVLSIGTKGPYGVGQMKKASPKLSAWLDAHPEWRIVGELRALSYNGPMRPASLYWGEVQIPVERRIEAEDGAAASSNGAESPAGGPKAEADRDASDQPPAARGEG